MEDEQEKTTEQLIDETAAMVKDPKLHGNLMALRWQNKKDAEIRAKNRQIAKNNSGIDAYKAKAKRLADENKALLEEVQELTQSSKEGPDLFDLSDRYHALRENMDTIKSADEAIYDAIVCADPKVPELETLLSLDQLETLESFYRNFQDLDEVNHRRARYLNYFQPWAKKLREKRNAPAKVTQPADTQPANA